MEYGLTQKSHQEAPKRLMILDDDESVGRSLAGVCQEFNFDVERLQDSAGLTGADFEACDVLLLDLMMPKLDGIEVLRLLGGCKHKPAIIIMSGLGQRLLNAAVQLAEFHGLEVLGDLKKPFRLERVRALIVQHYASRSVADGVAVAHELSPRLNLDDIAEALAKDQFRVYFQPQVRLSDSAWCGVEALVRWDHPVHGLIAPDLFIPLVDDSHLALPFTFEVLRKAIIGVQALTQSSGFEGMLSVNISPSSMDQIDIPERVEQELVQLNFPRARMRLEVTETALPKAKKVSLDVQARLAMRGIQLSIDDFGTGHSSLERLSDSPFQELKIDLIFVSRIEDSEDARSIVKNAISLGHSLAMTVTAEGVETEGQLRWLKEHGCDAAQGYYILPPSALPGVQAWAKNRLLPGAASALLAPKPP